MMQQRAHAPAAAAALILVILQLVHSARGVGVNGYLVPDDPFVGCGDLFEAPCISGDGAVSCKLGQLSVDTEVRETIPGDYH